MRKFEVVKDCPFSVRLPERSTSLLDSFRSGGRQRILRRRRGIGRASGEMGGHGQCGL